MEIDSPDRYGPIKTALKELGFKVAEFKKMGKKTVITVFDYKNDNNNTSPKGQESRLP